MLANGHLSGLGGVGMTQERIGRVEALQTQCMETNRDRFTEIRNSLATIHSRLDDQFVTQTEFKPVRNVVYGLVAFVLFAVLVAVVGSVVEHSTSVDVPLIP
jgi:thiosulfate reductase cytochrome b subunit